MVTASALAVDPLLDPEPLAGFFRHRKRLHIPGFLVSKDAQRLFVDLETNGEWQLIFNHGDQLFELGREQQGTLTAEQWKQLDQAIWNGAREQFQFRFENIRVPDSRAAREGSTRLLDQFAAFLSSEPALEFLQRVTGLQDITYADAQATAYSPGHFLTAHDDDLPGSNRRAAYVFNLTPSWKADWGGLLMFHGKDGHVDESFVPMFNALNIFCVPQPHSVSMVAPFAPNPRYSITGWLRAGEPPC